MFFLIISIIIISTVGTLSHFLYDFSHHNKFVGVFAAVNESVWEHIKITLNPSLLWGLVDGFIYGTIPSYFFAKASSLIVVIILMPLLYYAHKVILKKDSLLFDIIIFYVVVICSQLTFYYLLQIGDITFIIHYLSCVGLFVIFGCCMVFSLLPIKNFIFKDPLTNKYGYRGHSKDCSVNKSKKK